MASSLLFKTLLVSTATALYIPGIAPTEYRRGQDVPLYVNALNPAASTADQSLHNVVSYDYYLPKFHFCVPRGGPRSQSESLGSVLLGDRIYSSTFDIKFLQEDTCKTLCTTEVPPEDAGFINQRIRENYAVEWLIDGLPAASAMLDTSTNTPFDTPGFALGKSMLKLPDGGYESINYYNNFYEILIDYHRLDSEDYRIVGVEVVPRSAASGCDDSKPLILNETPGSKNTIEFTYNVRWRESDMIWATRWDKYLHVFDPRIHWFSLIESFAIVIFLTAMVAAVLVRTLKKDIQRYNTLDLDSDDIQEDSGWKLLHGDVFRPPSKPMLLSIMLGNGVQLFMMVGTTILFALLGFLSPSNRGSLATAIIVLYALYGFVGGFASAVLYKSFGKSERYKTLLAITPIFIPGIVFGTLVILNFFLIHKGASGAVPFGTLFALVTIWFGVSVPLSVIGGFLGFKFNIPADPVKTNQIPRQVPHQSFYKRSIPSILLSGTLPFGAIFVELYFIMSSLWFSRVYYMFGFLFLSYAILIITCAAVTILMTYFQLCSESYHWWWRSFFTGGAISIYIFLHSIVYYVTKLKLAGLSAVVLYFGYSLLLSFLVFVLAGTVGFFSSYWFVRKVRQNYKIQFVWQIAKRDVLIGCRFMGVSRSIESKC